MALVQLNLQPADRQLRQFGATCAAAFPLLGWLWGASWTWIGGLFAAGAALAALGYFWPKAVKPAFIGLSLVTLPIGFVVGELMVLLIYFGMFLPLALIFRVMGRDALYRSIDKNAATYWQDKPQPKGAASYYRQS